MKKLIKNIHKRQVSIAILGSGYVGLPTAALFADAGFHVISVDMKAEIVDAINSGISPINEPGLYDLISRNVQRDRLKATLNSMETLAKVEVVIISVQTPIGYDKKPDLSFLLKALDQVGKSLKKGMLVIISSTIPPRTMVEKIKPMLEILSELKADSEFYLAYVPERMTLGKALKEFIESPRFIGGIGVNSTKIAAELFRMVCRTVIETDATTAEIAKLAENTFRDVNIAFANQLALVCEQHGVDVMEVIRLANTHPRVNIHMPGPGVGGPCLTKDPYFLTYGISLKTRDLIGTARQINDYMPRHIVESVIDVLKENGKDVKSSTIAVLGTAYKGDVDDSRNSPSELIIKRLKKMGSKIKVYDPYCKETFGAHKTSSIKESVENADLMIVLTDHTLFKNLDLQKIKQLMRKKPIIIDSRRIVDPNEAVDQGFIYYGVGLGKL